MSTFRRLLGFLRPYRKGVIWSFVLAFGALGATVLIPSLTGVAINAISHHHRHELVLLAVALTIRTVVVPLSPTSLAIAGCTLAASVAGGRGNWALPKELADFDGDPGRPGVVSARGTSTPWPRAASVMRRSR